MQIYKYVIKISKFAAMKKLTSIFLLIIVFFSSCESDLDINSEWEEVTVVFGLLNQNQDKQYIRINKAFLGDQSAYVMAQISDSLNFSPENLEVKIEKTVPNSTVVIDTRILVDTVMFKDSGTFASDNNIVYTFDTDDFLTEGKSYNLTITHKNTGNVISAKTLLINDLELMSYFNNPTYKMGFYSISGDFANSSVEWYHSLNAEMYQLTMIVNYTEYGPTDTVVKSIQKDFPLIEHDDFSNEYLQQITGEGFFNFIANNIKKSSTVNRRINDIDFSLSAGGRGLQKYMNLNIPPTGVVQERPIYSEITNGYGLFACRINKLQENVSITSTTKEALEFHLDSLGFIYP